MKYRLDRHFNGYSNYEVKNISGQELVNFTLTFSFVPYTYESGWSGLFSAFNEKEKKGIAVGIGKRGEVHVKLGTGEQIFELRSLTFHLNYQVANFVSISFWGEAGWCDLCINGNISNRIQMPRHQNLIVPSGECYIGKYVDQHTYFSDSMRGVFHGRFFEIEFNNRYISYRKMMAEQLRGKIPYEKIDLYAEQNVEEDIYRPKYHLIPPGKWMNEPHAPFWYRGKYHIFYQANPHAPVWDNLCWGHLVSEDMVDWKYMGIALCPDEMGDEVDIDGCWSGSACIDQNGHPLLFYTAGDNSCLPNQSVALASAVNEEDENLCKWKKEGILIRQTFRDGFLGEFRDPFVFRKNGMYYILVGSGDAENGGGNAIVYTSIDLKNFSSHGFLMDYDYRCCQEVGHVWELPVLLPLSDGQHNHICDILLLCACQIEDEMVETYYFLGNFDEDSKKFYPFYKRPQLIDLGYGTFTGPSGFVTPDGRSVLFTIAQGRRGGREEYTAGWAHNGGIPLELSVVDNTLCVSPVRESREYFRNKTFEKRITSGESHMELEEQKLLENRVVVTANGEELVCFLDFGSDRYKIRYQRNERKFTAYLEKADRMISKYRNTDDLVYIGTEPISMEIFIDHSMIEIYLNQKKSMTLRNYRFRDAYHMDVESDGACLVEIWEYIKGE
ncbi:MAG: glycoside hydrolase family 32 protein [Acetatifactor sp.]|nr:glycoside hydrolase family 32 protein [Acetatifactor sp.]